MGEYRNDHDMWRKMSHEAHEEITTARSLANPK